MIIDEPEGATPLKPDDMEGLKHAHVTTREQLNELEQANILAGQMWVSHRTDLTADSIFSTDFILDLHQNLFGDVWTWAGSTRTRELSIGCDPLLVRENLQNFLEDAKLWIQYGHDSNLELCARIQHKLVEIHPFPNGNGRHSRIFTDVVRIFLFYPLSKATTFNLTLSKT
ncbi:mobile mystery protein B [Shewanella canadensis]|uniref:Mobile mystery protein B n=1 Tax=Shewanella canadensis TaxID=271096 RepID=A0A431WKK8_9GAMM|nr:mobile mystery protein B [Shewanella canadensis]